MKRLNDQGRELWEFDLNEAQLARLNKYASKRLRANSAMITEACKHVGGDPDGPLLNDEYLENARKAREYNKSRGHDRDEVLARTIAMERSDEVKAQEIHPIVWRDEKQPPVPNRGSLIRRFFSWIDRIRPGADMPFISREDYLGK